MNSTHGTMQPLYGVIATSGGTFSLIYHAGKMKPDGCREYTNASRQGYDLSVFRDAPQGLPVIDYRTADTSKVINLIFRTNGVKEAGNANGLPLEDYLQAARETGATITTVGEIKTTEV